MKRLACAALALLALSGRGLVCADLPPAALLQSSGLSAARLQLDRLLYRRQRRRRLRLFEVGYDQLVQSDRRGRRRHAGLQLPDRRRGARRRRRHRLGGHLSGSTTGGCPAGCKTERFLAFDHTRTARLRGRSIHAVHHRRRRFRQYPSLNSGPWRRKHDQCRLDRRCWPRIRRGTATGPLKAEYLYVDLGKFNCGVGCGAAVDNVSFSTNLIRGGFNYRF